ncbi:hypothetical protein EG68_03016 [Paragonimus skrjabini miyazakii]|uniref:Uncharacterized protein n=1 Tax=Paragonimus skrjabini miyazakii TaxID=59628 RepID=A0A8S9YYW4_9TREM|nr:hypothetical protein EG68_03016 [Paragonimus skrjabini miyazakii]
MLAAFGRKQRTKPGNKPHYLTTQMPLVQPEISNICSDDQIAGEIEQHKLVLRSSLLNGFSSDKTKRRSCSASPQPNLNGRRVPGASVTFQSTLPTEVWLASPSPSPPLSDHKKHSPNSRMAYSVSDDWVVRETCSLKDTKQTRTRGKKIARRSTKIDFKSWLSDMELDDSSDETNPSGVSQHSLSSCSSTDESLPGLSRRTERQISSSNTTVTTDSSSSLDLQLVRKGNETQSGVCTKSRAYSNSQKGQRVRKCNSEKKRRATLPTTQSKDRSSSSSSTSSDDELSALGWDEKAIAALANRGKNRKQCMLRLPDTLPDMAVKTESKSAPCPNHTKDVIAERVVSSLQMVQRSPFNNKNQPSPERALSHPHSCVLARRTNRSGRELVDYTGLSRRQLRTYQNNIVDIRLTQGLHTELLAVITTNYKPTPQWEQEYQVLIVREGEYVCVLSQPMPSRRTVGPANCKQLHDVHNKHTKSDIMPKQNTNETNTWLYVRRWCVDHLVATGPPGFVPHHYCRLLTSTEILALWQRSQSVRASRCQNLIPTTITSASCQVHSAVVPCPKLSKVPNDVALKVKHMDIREVSFAQKGLPKPFCDSNSPTPSLHPLVHSGTTLYEFQPMHLGLPITDHSTLPPPPPGFGSGGSFGSEIEDRDSGRGPSSGSEWGSGRGGSSTVTLDRSTMDKTFSDIGLERKLAQTDDRLRNTKSAEESQLRWYANDGSLFSSELSSNRVDELCSRDSALQSPSTTLNDLTRQVQTKAGEYQTHSEHGSTTVTLTTRTGCTPVLEMRPGATPILYARSFGNSVATTNGNESLVTSTTTTCTTVIDSKVNHESQIRHQDQVPTADPGQWEPYKTVIHVNENTLEKFTLV